ncbi:MAG TPA: UDP-3-O-acyl-N-acetylglucosamine deacetylase [Candidatus Tyrphobacter sp.]
MQTTLRSAVRFEGVGLHTGADTRIDIRPAAPDFGLQFLLDGVHVPATAEYVVDTSRATVIGMGERRVSTVEHVLSALVGLGVTNAELVVIGPEVPIVDGSAQAFADAIASAGIESQHRPCTMLELDEPFEIRERDRALILLPSERLRVRFLADFPPPVGVQYFDCMMDPKIYRTEIAPARTFGYLHEVEALRARGLARGGSLENALIFSPEGAMQPLRWPDEVVRHKVLDLLGDLALLGFALRCDVIAVKSGHELHARAMLALRARHRATQPAGSA